MLFWLLLSSFLANIAVGFTIVCSWYCCCCCCCFPCSSCYSCLCSLLCRCSCCVVSVAIAVIAGAAVTFGTAVAEDFGVVVIINGRILQYVNFVICLLSLLTAIKVLVHLRVLPLFLLSVILFSLFWLLLLCCHRCHSFCNHRYENSPLNYVIVFIN